MNAQRLANGRLLIPVRAEFGGILGDGVQEIGPDHPDYVAWLAEASKFATITMPDQFLLEVHTENGGWIDYGVFRAADFDRLEDGTSSAPGTAARRSTCAALSNEAPSFQAIHGTHDVCTYRLAAYPSERYGPTDS